MERGYFTYNHQWPLPVRAQNSAVSNFRSKDPQVSRVPYIPSYGGTSDNLGYEKVVGKRGGRGGRPMAETSA